MGLFGKKHEAHGCFFWLLLGLLIYSAVTTTVIVMQQWPAP